VRLDDMDIDEHARTLLCFLRRKTPQTTLTHSTPDHISHRDKLPLCGVVK
jgi:hypothetical protein